MARKKLNSDNSVRCKSESGKKAHAFQGSWIRDSRSVDMSIFFRILLLFMIIQTHEENGGRDTCIFKSGILTVFDKLLEYKCITTT